MTVWKKLQRPSEHQAVEDLHSLNDTSASKTDSMPPSEATISKVQDLKSQFEALTAGYIPPDQTSVVPPISSGRLVRNDITQNLLTLLLEIRVFMHDHEDEMNSDLESEMRKLESEVQYLNRALQSTSQWDTEVYSAEVLENMVSPNDINMTNDDGWWEQAAKMLEQSANQLVEIRDKMSGDRAKLAYVSMLWATFRVRPSPRLANDSLLHLLYYADLSGKKDKEALLYQNRAENRIRACLQSLRLLSRQVEAPSESEGV